MRIKYTKVVAFIIVFVNICLVYYALSLFSYHHKNANIVTTSPPNQTKPPSNNKSTNKHISKLITVIIREFETNENDVSATVESVLKVSSSIQVYVLYDKIPYPPLSITTKNVSIPNVKLWNLAPSIGTSSNSFSLQNINTKYILFIPDATRLLSKQSIQKILSKSVKNKGAIFVSQVSRNKDLECYRLNVNNREWSLKYNLVKSSYCDSVNGKHVILLETELLKKLNNPFLLPFPSSLYIQTAALSVKVFIVKNGLFYEGKTVFKSLHAQWKLKQIIQERLKRFYNNFKIKMVMKEGKTEWYGCNRQTSRCFEDVVDSMPSYLYEKKWTPPCCLSHLRKTTKYVLETLDQFGIRYWLEAGSLLGAVRSGDILPWDHDVDVGFINDDSNRCKWLHAAYNKSIVDDKGFFWEKVKTGNYYRVNFSKYNKIYVNLYPFFCKNGTMSRDLFYDSRRNMEFPDNFLHPMSSIEFIGRNAPCPNNVRDFLEFKYGKGCIENPEYPNPLKMKFLK